MPRLKPGSRNLISSAASAPRARIKFSLPGKPLSRKFYARDTHAVAKELLGKVVVRVLRGQKISGRITEVEAYVGEDDLACHAARGPAWPAGRRTPRTDIMYGEAGYAYIYLIYGMYHCLNIVTEQKNFPAAVLIRALEPLTGLSQMHQKRKTLSLHNVTNGPGKLSQALSITTQLNGEDTVKSKQLYVADDGYIVKSPDIATSPRIGVAYAGACALYPWRYYLHNSLYISR